MKQIGAIVAVLAVAATQGAWAADLPLGAIQEAPGVTFFSHSLTSLGSFADFYTFTMPTGSSRVDGDVTSVAYSISSPYFNISSDTRLTAFELFSSTGATLSIDTNTADGFSFGDLIGGSSYKLAVLGNVIGTPGTTGFYSGAIAAAVPEPESYALALAGLAVVAATRVKRRAGRRTKIASA